MKNALLFVGKAILSGFVIIVPIYLAVLLLLKALASVAKLVRPLTLLLPEWLPAGQTLLPAAHRRAVLCDWRRRTYSEGADDPA